MIDITMYSTQTCPFCVRAQQYLAMKPNVRLTKISIDMEPAQRAIMIGRTGQRSVPQIFVGDHHVGGYDDLVAIDRAGLLDALFSGFAGLLMSDQN